MFCFDFRSNFLVSISFLINIGKEMSLPGFRNKYIDNSEFTKILVMTESVQGSKLLSQSLSCVKIPY